MSAAETARRFPLKGETRLAEAKSCTEKLTPPTSRGKVVGKGEVGCNATTKPPPIRIEEDRGADLQFDVGTPDVIDSNNRFADAIWAGFQET